MANIGFIGLGNMGLPMALNLIKAGHQVSAFDLVQSSLETARQAGAKVVANPAEICEAADFVISMLPAGKHVTSVYLGENGLIEHLSANTLVIDSSTIDVESAQRVATALAEKQIEFVDAPVSGGVGGAQAGTLSFMVGGHKENFDKANSVLLAMGKNIFHAGDTGAGQVAKMCNNMLLSVLMTGTAEALQMGIKNGLDPKVLSDIMLKSSGRNWTLELYNPCPDVMEGVPSSNQYQGGFMVDLMAKDLGLAAQAAVQSGASTPMGSLARSLYAMHATHGNGKKDFSSIFEMFSKEE
jgi:3-hydroxyisobutyrate dehydrogenase